MTQYLLSVWTGENDAIPGYREMPGREELAQLMTDIDTFNSKLQATGAWIFAGGLVPPSAAAVVRHSADGVTTTDGPFAETKEAMGGFWIVEAPDDEAAHALAAEGSAACRAAVEVRRFHCEPQLEEA